MMRISKRFAAATGNLLIRAGTVLQDFGREEKLEAGEIRAG